MPKAVRAVRTTHQTLRREPYMMVWRPIGDYRNSMNANSPSRRRSSTNSALISPDDFPSLRAKRSSHPSAAY